jgi:hypothetical protein
VKVTLKEYKQRNAAKCRSGCCSCKQAYVKLLEGETKERLEKKSEQMNCLIQPKDARNI